jgi:hypothetical protein
VTDAGQPADAPQGDLQAPIPQTVTAQGDPMPADQMPADEAPAEGAPTDAMPVAEGDQPAQQTVVTEGGETPTVGEARRVVKVVQHHVVRQHGYAPRVVHYVPVREVYVPTYHVQRVYRHHHDYGHRVHSHGHHGYGHHGHRGHGHRRW